MQHKSTDWSEEWLTAVLNSIIPGDGRDWPAAGDHGIGTKVLDFLQLKKDGMDCIGQVFSTCGSDFCNIDCTLQAERLSNVEASKPEAFETLLVATYNMYYTDPEIRQIIERLTGYEARPPQPLGYEMEPFDEKLLDTVRKRKPFWRKETNQ